MREKEKEALIYPPDCNKYTYKYISYIYPVACYPVYTYFTYLLYCPVYTSLYSIFLSL